MTKKLLLSLVAILAIGVIGYYSFFSSNDQTDSTSELDSSYEAPTDPHFEYGVLPDIKWLTNDKDVEIADPNAKKGGTFNTYMDSYPMSFRTVGPDSNGSFVGYLRNFSSMGLLDLHPDTRNFVPAIATHWAFDSDQQTMYFKLNPKATWSDGVPLTAKDFAYTLEFMRSKWIYAPWYNDYYYNTIEKVIIYDDHTLAIKGRNKKSNDENGYSLTLSPTPEHYYRPILDKDWTKKHNWSIAPVVGPYQISDYKRGKEVTLSKVKNWWAGDERYFRNTANFDKIKIEVVRDPNMAFEYFLKGNIDVYSLSLPLYWDKAVGKDFDNGYISKLWFYNETERPNAAIWLNSQKWPFTDQNARLAFNHALNFDKVISEVRRNEPVRLNRYSQGVGKYDNTKVISRKFDIQKVHEYMEKANWTINPESGLWHDPTTNQDFVFELIYGSETLNEVVAVLREEALKAGIDMRLKLMDANTSFKTALEKQHQASYFALTTKIIPNYWESWHSDNAKPQTNNFTMINDSELDQLIDEIRIELNDLKKHELSKKIQAKIHDLGIYVPTFIPPFVRAGFWSWIKMPKKLPKDTEYLDGALLLYLWFDQDANKKILEAKEKGTPYQNPVLIMDTTYKGN